MKDRIFDIDCKDQERKIKQLLDKKVLLESKIKIPCNIFIKYSIKFRKIVPILREILLSIISIIAVVIGGNLFDAFKEGTFLYVFGCCLIIGGVALVGVVVYGAMTFCAGLQK